MNSNNCLNAGSTVAIPEHNQVIHLQNSKSVLAYANSNNNSSNDDEFAGEEVRPVPLQTHDVRLQILQAVQQDHTYANPIPAGLLPNNAQQQQQQQLLQSTTAANNGITNSSQKSPQQKAHWSLGGIRAALAAAPPSGEDHSAAVVGSSTGFSSLQQPTYTMYGQQCKLNKRHRKKCFLKIKFFHCSCSPTAR